MNMQPNGKRIRDLREQRAWPQAQLADIAGVSERTIQRVEQGESVAFETLKSIASAFNLDVNEIVHREEGSPEVDFLVRVTTGNEPFGVIAASHAGRHAHDELRNDAEVELVSSLFQDIQDYSDIWDDIGPGGHVKAQHEFTSRLTELADHGLWVFVVKKTEKFRTGTQLTPMRVSTIFVARSDNPTIIQTPEQSAVFPAAI